jgi:ABC-type transport system substrate-binding protein
VAAAVWPGHRRPLDRGRRAASISRSFSGRWYCDPKLDALQAAAAQELDRTKRKAILAQVQHYLHDRGPYYFLWTELGHRGYSARVGTNGSEGPIDYASYYDWWNMNSRTVTR